MGVTLPQARQVIRDVIQIFGVERTIYGSNFPLEKLHAQLRRFLRRLPYSAGGISPKPSSARCLHDNAVKFYRL